MDWIPDDTDFLTVFGAVLGAGTALLGLVVGLSQFTMGARTRRIIEWTSAALKSEKDPGRQLILQRLMLGAQGRLVAARYVPGRLFSEAFIWILLAPATVIFSISRSDAISTVVTISANVLLVALVARHAIRLYTERIRVAYQFTLGGIDIEPVRVDMLSQMEGGTRREFILGFICSISVTGTGALLAWAVLAEHGSIAWVWAGLGLFACWSCFHTTHIYAKKWAENASKNLV